MYLPHLYFSSNNTTQNQISRISFLVTKMFIILSASGGGRYYDYGYMSFLFIDYYYDYTLFFYYDYDYDYG